MLNFLPAPIVGLIAGLLAFINILVWCSILFVFTFLKLIIPNVTVRKWLTKILTGIAENWISGNGAWMALTQNTQWKVEGIESLEYKGWYLVNSNHQTWVDIFVLQKVFNRKIPLLKFFLKQELAKIPIMGQAWWALDFPFMRRYSKAYIEKHPEMQGKDMETTRKACEKFSEMPTSVMNFLEGTRFTKAKHQHQSSPYKNLLLPKAGGVAFAISALGDKFDSMLNVTLVYPGGAPSFWEFLCGRMKSVTVQVESVEIPTHFQRGDYNTDPVYRGEFQAWIQQLWKEKDKLIEELSVIKP